MSFCINLSKFARKLNTVLQCPNILKSTKITVSNLSLSIQRTYCNIPNKIFIGRKTLDQFHKRDGIPPSFTLIYRTDFPNYLLSTQIFVFLSIGACVTTLILSIIQSSISKEEKEEKEILRIKIQEEMRKQIEEQRADTQVKLNEILKKSPSKTDTIEIYKPSMADLYDNELDTFVALVIGLLTLMLGLFRLIRILPVRVYVGKQNHCVGVFYGSIIPGKLTRHEFIAGKLTKHESKFGKGIMGDSSFKDGSGHTIVLMEQFFRQPADFNYLLGLQRVDFDSQAADELSQLKNVIASLDQKTKKKRMN